MRTKAFESIDSGILEESYQRIEVTHDPSSDVVNIGPSSEAARWTRALQKRENRFGVEQYAEIMEHRNRPTYSSIIVAEIFDRKEQSVTATGYVKELILLLYLYL
jgi:hypothetical protein